MKIYINPGHGGDDPGAIGYNGLREVDVNKKIADRVTNYLQVAGLTVREGQFGNLSEISNDANRWGADFFVSIHCNSYDTRVRGTEAYCFRYFSEGEILAECINRQLISKLDLVNRGIKTASFSVLRRTSMPACLIECAFIDNPNDAQLLIQREDDFARAIAVGITDFLSHPIPDVLA